jgi:glutamyl-tRNA synthetase/glutamyl-Q tRNA(Asp) synthetase
VIVSRFAPAPTGYLHLGHVVNAIYVWGITRARGGRVLLRIEDHDRQRCRPEFDAAILEDLKWLGFEFDGPLVRQSDRGAVYDRALDRLRARGLVYACDCSRAKIAALSPVEGDERRYPGTCAHKGLPEAPGLGLRVRLAPSVERFIDLRHGRQEQRPSEQCGDLLARDRDGHWTYQFAATVDDLEQEVTLVIRGDDLLPSTGRQIQLALMLGRSRPPSFLHALIMKSADQKLSKSDGDTGVRELRTQGWAAAELIGQSAARAGLIEKARPIEAREAEAIIQLPPGGVSFGS